jgi:protein O-mannosyl-transferase
MKTLVHSFLNPSSRWYYPLHWLVLILLGLAIYAQTFGFNFVFDDNYFMFNTPYIRGFDQVDQIWAIFPKTRMIGVYSFALNYWIGRFDPQGYHIFNFMVHLLAAGLVWALAGILFKITRWLPTEDRMTKELPFIIALFFLVHPCQTQAVTYISQRFESMATVFYLGSIYLYLCGRMASSLKHKILLFAGALGFAVLGIFTKEVAATIPLMVLAAEFIFFNRKPHPLIILLGVIFACLLMKIVRTDFISIYFHFSAPSESHDGDIITGGKYVLTQMRVFLTFLRLLVFPVDQNLDYDYPLSTGLLHPPLTLVGLGLIGFTAFLIFRLRHQWPLISFGLAWVLITFSINTAPRVNVIFEHKLYLISFGFFLAAACALSAAIKDRKILIWILMVLIAGLSLVSYNRNQVWKNDLTLWQDTVRKSPHKARPLYNCGFAYFNRGDFNKAMSDFNEAIKIRPDYIEAFINRGIIYYEAGRLTEALSDFNKALAINPKVAEALYNRGNVYLKQNNFTQALWDYNKAIELDPGYAEAYTNRGSLYEKEGYFIKALSDYNKAIEIYPPVGSSRELNRWVNRLKISSVGYELKGRYNSYADAFYNRGCVCDRLGYLAGALSDYNTAIELNPDYADAYNNRGHIYGRQGNYIQALQDYNKAIEINPNIGGYYYNRAISYYELREYVQALADARTAQKLGVAVNPEFLSALNKAL